MRERKNTARYLPGFQFSHCNVKTGSVFAKFDSPESALAALERLNNDPYDMDNEALGGLKADLAKREVEPPEKPQKAPMGGFGGKGGGVPAYAPSYAPIPAMSAAPTHFTPRPAMPVSASLYASPGAASSVAAGSGAIDTVAILKVGEQGWTAEQINETFGMMPGFIVCQYNERIDGCFVKFGSPRQALQAVQGGSAYGLQVSLAKRSLTVDGKGGGKGSAPPAAAPASNAFGGLGSGGSYPSAAPAAKRPRIDDAGGPIDTLAITKLATHGLTADTVLATLSGMGGFSSSQYNERIDGLFAKFLDAGSAAHAKSQAEALGLPVEFAKRSLNER